MFRRFVRAFIPLGIVSIPFTLTVGVHPCCALPALYDVCFADTANGIAVGNYDVIVRTSDGGLSWETVQQSADGKLFAVDFYDVLNGMAVGNWYGAFRTSDGGVSWSPMTLPIGAGDHMGGVAMTGPGSAVAVGWDEVTGISGTGYILRTTDGGNNWTPSSYLPPDISGRGVDFSDPANGVALFSAVTVTTPDSGKTWNELPNTTLYDVLVDASGIGYAVGANGALYYTQNTGQSWDVLDSGTSTLLRSVHFINPDTVLVAGNDGVVLQTWNGGATWLEMTVIEGQLNGAVIVDDQVRILVGETFYSPGNPVQAIVLRSDNGGATWSSLTVPVEKSTLGSIKAIFR